MTLAEIDQHYKKGTVGWYEAAYLIMKFVPFHQQAILDTANRVLAGKSRYMDISMKTGVPWRLIGCLHNMECNCDFRGVLHNGERIVGTGQRTTIVPIGRGPFATWEIAALDALKLDGLNGVKNWSVGLELMYAEKFNGWGYIMYHPKENSPYVWACTSINDGHGKYVRDRVFDENAPTDGQVGVAAIYKQIDLIESVKGA